MRIFLLSPANYAGRRAALLTSGRASFSLARQLRGEGATLAAVFSFISGLYFRGKMTYARAFAASLSPPAGIHVITSGRGLLDPDTLVTLGDLQQLAALPIDPADSRYREAVLRDAEKIAAILPAGGQAVLLGSVASDKYVEVLLQAFGDRLVVPQAFVGRGDLSRGSLLLRAVDAGEELTYMPALNLNGRRVRVIRDSRKNPNGEQNRG